MASRPERKAARCGPSPNSPASSLVVLAAKTAIAEPFYVPSGSMEPTLLIGDELLATKFSYGYSTASLPSFLDFPPAGASSASEPKRGDVVVFRWPGDRTQVWVKRVIGLPGDRIALRGGQRLHQRRAGQARRRRHRHGGDRQRRAHRRPSASPKCCRAACSIRSSSWRRSARSTICPRSPCRPAMCS